jgi:thiol-disulfide isomerase/thioredoxin
MKPNLLIFAFIFSFSNIWSQNKTIDFTVTDIYGNTHVLSDYQSKNKSVFIEFFSTGCGSCKIEGPIIDTVFRNFGCNYGNIVFLAMNQHTNNQGVYNFVQTYKMSFPAVSGLEGNGAAVFDTFNISYTPFKLLIDPQNKIRINDMLLYNSAFLADTLHFYGFTEKKCEGKDFFRYSILNDISDFQGIIDTTQKKISVNIPANISISEILSNFIISPNSKVYVNGILQISGKTYNDFSVGPLIYNIVAEDGTSQNWIISVNQTSDVVGIELFSDFKISSNPISENSLLNISSVKETPASIEILDISGKVISAKTINLDSGKNQIQFSEICQKLSKGFYILKISADKEYFSKIMY